MGVFDTVHCHYPLPDIPDDLRESTWWQTKDLDCTGWAEYTITKEGRLLEHKIKWEWVDDETRPIIKGYMAKATEELVDMNFHGILNFYSLVGQDFKTGTFYDFNAKFTDGQLVSVTRLEEPAAESDGHHDAYL